MINLRMSQKSDEPDLWYAYGGYRQHIVQALLLAARSGYTDIVRCVLHADQSVLDETISGNGNKLWMQAVVEGLANIYKVAITTLGHFMIHMHA